MRVILLALISVGVCAASATAAPIDELPSPIVTRQTVFSIPFTVPAATDPARLPAEVRLFYSADSGASWNPAGQIDLRKQTGNYRGSFTFRAPHDGDYWFAIRTVDSQGRMRSEKQGGPELRVAVDTVPPRLDLKAQRGSAGELIARWNVVDPNPKSESLKLEVQADGDLDWRPIAIDPQPASSGRSAATGAATWWPTERNGLVTLRATVSDAAGNQTVAHAKLDLGGAPTGGDLGLAAKPATSTAAAQKPAEPTWPFSNRVESQDRASLRPAETAATRASPAPDRSNNPPGSAWRWPADVRTDLPLGAAERISNLRREPDPTPPPRGPRPVEPPRIDGPLLGRASDTVDSAQDHPTARSEFAAGSRTPSPNVANWPPGEARRVETETPRPIADRPTGSSLPGNSIAPSIAPAEDRPRMVNSRTFEMDYDLDSIGPSGVAKVELFQTRDGGKNWESAGVDNDNRSPLRATAPGEGIFGFRIAVQSGSGLGGRPPQPGEAPEVWIGVDLTRPVARIVKIEPATPERAGALTISWESSDSALADRPAALFYGAAPGGPWIPIASRLESQGSFDWRYPENAPDRLYFRLEIRDEAGNVGEYETANPTLLERIAPQGRLRAVRPVNDQARRGGPQIYDWRR